MQDINHISFTTNKETSEKSKDFFQKIIQMYCRYLK